MTCCVLANLWENVIIINRQKIIQQLYQWYNFVRQMLVSSTKYPSVTLQIKILQGQKVIVFFYICIFHLVSSKFLFFKITTIQRHYERLFSFRSVVFLNFSLKILDCLLYIYVCNVSAYFHLYLKVFQNPNHEMIL